MEFSCPLFAFKVVLRNFIYIVSKKLSAVIIIMWRVHCCNIINVLQAFHSLHVMYHEATACHVSGDLLELLAILLDLMKCLRMYRENKDVRGVLLGTKEWVEVLRKLATLLNTYNSSEMRASCIGKYNILLFPLFELSSFHFT